MSAIELVIFDCDGVLVDSEPLANAVLAKWLTAHGVPTTTGQALQRYKGRSLKSVREMAEAQRGSPLPDTFFEEMQAETYAVFAEKLEAVPGARALVEHVQRRGYSSCIASSGDYEKLDITLSKTGLKPLFEGRIFSSVDVENGKPAPDLFLHTARQMDTPPQRCVVIEDSPAGVTAALAAGMQVFAYNLEARKHDDVTCVSDLRQIIQAL